MASRPPTEDVAGFLNGIGRTLEYRDKEEEQYYAELRGGMDEYHPPASPYVAPEVLELTDEDDWREAA